MRVVISQRHLSLNKGLAEEANKLSKTFDEEAYSKIEHIDNILLKRDISVESKKRILVKKLHHAVVGAFSLDKRRFSKKAFESLKRRLHGIREIIIKLRSINYYLETIFLEELKLSKFEKISEARKSLRFSTLSKAKVRNKSPSLKQQNNLARDELGALEYTACKLISEVIMLDKRLVGEYKHKERIVFGKEKTGVKDLSLILGKESGILEHMEAKLPPPKATSMDLVKEPTFTHWVARVFALLAYLEHIYAKEKMIFTKLKKSKALRKKINKRITYLIKEKSKLLKIMEEKAFAVKAFGTDNIKRELHKITVMMNL